MSGGSSVESVLCLRHRRLSPAFVHEREFGEAVRFSGPGVEIRPDRFEPDAALGAAHAHAVTGQVERRGQVHLALPGWIDPAHVMHGPS